MSNDVVVMITKIIEWLAMPLVYVVLGIIFFLLIVKPFFSYIFDPDRINSHNAAEEKNSMLEASMELDELIDDDLLLEPDEDIPNILTDDQKIAKLAASSPSKGQALVKQWLNSDQKQKKPPEQDSGQLKNPTD